jgi:hypothetical protein
MWHGRRSSGRHGRSRRVRDLAGLPGSHDRARISAVFTGTDTDPGRPGNPGASPVHLPPFRFGSARFRQGRVGGYPNGYLAG